MTASDSLFDTYVSIYLHEDSYQIDMLKNWVEKPDNVERATQFKEEFADVLASHSLSAKEAVRLVNMPFTTNEEVYEWLVPVYAYLFEEGPYAEPW